MMPPLLPMLAALAAVSGVCLATGTPGARADHIVQPKEGKVSQNQLIDFNDAATVAPYRVEVLPNGDTWLVACFVPPNDACWSFKRFEETGDYVDVKVSPE